MTPYFSDEWLTVYAGDARDVLPALAAGSVDCIVTSPPYWGLRDYGTDGQLGLEATPEEYVANLVAVFRELRRVLKPSGTCWLNLGDSYSGGGGGYSPDAPSVERRNEALAAGDRRSGSFVVPNVDRRENFKSPGNVPGLKPKDLVGIPWRVAFALQADGWYLRSDIIWAKPNPMPESVTDRPTKAHEYLFLLTRSPRYYFDSDAVREMLGEWSKKALTSNWSRKVKHGGAIPGRSDRRDDGMDPATSSGNGYGDSINPAGRNLRSVWTIATRPYPGAHFAVFPPELPERCIKAGSSERGVCPECGAPWERVVEREQFGKAFSATKYDHTAQAGPLSRSRQAYRAAGLEGPPPPTLLGWRPTCAHAAESVPAVILDPFAGSGTVGLVANRLSRRAILIDLNADYLRQQMQRNAQTPLGLGA